MNVYITSTIVSFITAIIWLLFIYKLDKYDKEPLKLILKVFLGGVVFSFLALYVNSYVSTHYGMIKALMLVGFIEEFVKFLPVFLIAYNSKYFDEPLDGLFYAGVSALGFAFMENITYNKIILQHFQNSS
jgi:RsiW-degrading membrane proteinase PrsW (M82 family)